MKYVVTQDEDGKEEIFIFPKRYHHDDFADTINGLKTFKNGNPDDWERQYKTPIAAGFTDGKHCSGRSETLNLDSRGRLDELLIE
ncbi:hypothetical protein [Pseudomonas serbica]|uniref:hypothetical protein n=1 Tax=Pseudomonas serbica TaxID=2965074 RepID=UPI00237B49B9|nr:hypothetical protein [Pseudomonas serbica]